MHRRIRGKIHRVPARTLPQLLTSKDRRSTSWTLDIRHTFGAWAWNSGLWRSGVLDVPVEDPSCILYPVSCIFPLLLEPGKGTQSVGVDTAGISCWDRRSQVKNIEATSTGCLNLVTPLFGLTICRTGKRCFLNVVFLGSVIPGPNPHCVFGS